MMNHFRRNALQLTLAALFSSAFYAQAADIPQVKVTVTDKQCEPMNVTVKAGKTQFIIQNHSQKALEWEILKGVMVVEERENIAPGFTQKLTANLQPGEYDMTCGLLTNPKGKLTVTGEATKDAAKADALLSLGEAITAYKAWVTAETAELVSGTKAFTDAVKAGDIEKAKALYAPTRQHYERIEPIAELFSDLDGSIDAREDDYEKKAEDPKFTGFHRLEKALFGDNSVKGMDNYADQLNADVLELQKRISELAFPPSKVVGGAAGLIEEVAPAKSAEKKIATAIPTCGISRPTLTARRKSSTCCVRSCKKRTARCWRRWMPTSKRWTPFSANTAPKMALRPMTS